ncbi:MAG: A/G-specific adenine glycosylase, partial [Proteobacteria bacterium]
MASVTDGSFSARIIAWQLKNGRHNLPWQGDNPYHVWLSEIMLQQTQVVKVIDYFNHFIKTFPTLPALANADEQAVMALWSGLGYYSRARNLHKAARLCVKKHNGQLPDNMSDLMALPGIGRTTAAAIMSLAYDQPKAILDGNVKRVMARYFKVAGEPNSGPTLKKLWQLAEQQQTTENPRAYSQGLM